MSNNYSTIKMWGSHLCLGNLAVFLNKKIQVTIVWFPPRGELMSMWRFIIILDHENLIPTQVPGNEDSLAPRPSHCPVLITSIFAYCKWSKTGQWKAWEQGHYAVTRLAYDCVNVTRVWLAVELLTMNIGWYNGVEQSSLVCKLYIIMHVNWLIAS